MKYKKCPRCGLNYILCSQNICFVCQDELDGKQSIFDETFDEIICPICGKNKIDIDEVMCKQCMAKRSKNHFDV